MARQRKPTPWPAGKRGARLAELDKLKKSAGSSIANVIDAIGQDNFERIAARGQRSKLRIQALEQISRDLRAGHRAPPRHRGRPRDRSLPLGGLRPGLRREGPRDRLPGRRLLRSGSPEAPRAREGRTTTRSGRDSAEGGIVSDYPEHDKLKAISDKSQAIGEFLDWLMYGGLDDAAAIHYPGRRKRESYGGIELAYRIDKPQGRSSDLTPLNWPIEKILGAYFEIDADKIESEKRAMLRSIRVTYRPVTARTATAAAPAAGPAAE